MLTSFKNKPSLRIPKQNESTSNNTSNAPSLSNATNFANSSSASNAALKLLNEALYGIIHENTHRVYIDDVSYLVELKLPPHLKIEALSVYLQQSKIKFQESKIMNTEIIVHIFAIVKSSETSSSSENLETFEAWYKPLPRLRF